MVIYGENAHRDSDRPDVVEDERTTEISSVSIALIVIWIEEVSYTVTST